MWQTSAVSALIQSVVVKTELSVKPDLLICVSTLARSHKLRKKIRFKWWKWVLPQRGHEKPGHLGGTLSQAGLDGLILIWPCLQSQI